MLCYVILCQVRLGQVRLGQVMLCYVMLCYVMLCYVRLGQVRLYLVMLGQVRLGQVRLGQAHRISDNYHKSCEFKPNSVEVYQIQHYVIKFVSELRQVGVFHHQTNQPTDIKGCGLDSPVVKVDFSTQTYIVTTLTSVPTTINISNVNADVCSDNDKHLKCQH